MGKPSQTFRWDKKSLRFFGLQGVDVVLFVNNFFVANHFWMANKSQHIKLIAFLGTVDKKWT